MLFICYPPCTTCQKAQRYLTEHKVPYEIRNIKTEPPKEEELALWHQRSGLALKRFFNTSGLRYKELGLKEKLETLTEAEQYALLASDGMLVKRPIVVDPEFVLVGFRQKEWDTWF